MTLYIRNTITAIIFSCFVPRFDPHYKMYTPQSSQCTLYRTIPEGAKRIRYRGKIRTLHSCNVFPMGLRRVLLLRAWQSRKVYLSSRCHWLATNLCLKFVLLNALALIKHESKVKEAIPLAEGSSV